MSRGHVPCFAPGDMTIKIKVGSLVLTATRDESIPQEFAAWHQTVRIAPGTYDIFAYLDMENRTYHVRQPSAECPGITVSSNFRSHMLGVWGKSDNNKNGQPATAHVGLPTYGLVEAVSPSLLSQAVLCDALMRVEFDPRETSIGKMWRFAWNPDHKPLIIESPRHGGGLSRAAFEDHRRFRAVDVEMSPEELSKLDIMFQDSFLHNANQLTVGETATVWSFHLQQSYKVTRLA